MFLKFADWFVYGIIGMSAETSFGKALHFFVYDVLKILFLLFTIISVITYLRSYIDNEKLKTFIEKQPKVLSHLFASIFGAITPFCSCSSIPVFQCAGVPDGIRGGFPAGHSPNPPVAAADSDFRHPDFFPAQDDAAVTADRHVLQPAVSGHRSVPRHPDRAQDS